MWMVGGCCVCYMGLTAGSALLKVVNSFAPGICVCNLYLVIFKLILQNSLATHCEIALKWMPQNLTNKKSTLVQVMVWCRQATSLTWANVDPDLCHHMASLGHTELNDPQRLILSLIQFSFYQTRSAPYLTPKVDPHGIQWGSRDRAVLLSFIIYIYKKWPNDNFNEFIFIVVEYSIVLLQFIATFVSLRQCYVTVWQNTPPWSGCHICSLGDSTVTSQWQFVSLKNALPPNTM